MSWLEQKLKNWGVLELSPDEKKQQNVQKQAEVGEKDMQATRKEKAEKEQAEDDLKLVIDGAKIECMLCTKPEGTLKVNVDTPTTQDKATATNAEKDAISLVFDGNCKKSPNSASPCKAVMQLDEWEDVGNGKIQDNEPLLLKSTIKCTYGGTPITITDCGQKHEPEEIDTEGAPVLIDEEPEKVKYVIKFSRLPTYDGEFGFDWMRKEYLPKEEGGKGVCIEGLDELKKVYTPFEMDIKNQKGKAYGNYYSPWVSMFPKHKEKIGKPVRLKLKVDADFIEKDIPSGEIVKFESSDPNLEIGVEKMVYNTSTGKGETILIPSPTFDEVKGGATIQIKCNGKLTEDTTIDVLSSDSLTVGRLNVMKNDTEYKLNIKFVKICKERHLKYLKEKFDSKITELDDFLKNNSLNQALIKPKVLEKNYDNIEFINLDDLPDDMFGSGRISINKKGRKELKKRCISTNNFKGLVIFYLGVENVTSKAGDTQTYPLNEQFIYLYLNSVLNRDLAHEVGHALGLQHTFIETSNFLKKLQVNLKNYKQQLATTELHKNNPRYNQESVSNKIDILKQRIKKQKKKIEDFKSISDKNPYKFKEGQSSNMMDYVEDYNAIMDFQHWQWLVMQREIITYYN